MAAMVLRGIPVPRCVCVKNTACFSWLQYLLPKRRIENSPVEPHVLCGTGGYEALLALCFTPKNYLNEQQQ